MVELIISPVAVMLEVIYFNAGDPIYPLFRRPGLLWRMPHTREFSAHLLPLCACGPPVSWKELLYSIIPVITITMVFTNDLHHLFYVSYSPAPTAFRWRSDPIFTYIPFIPMRDCWAAFFYLIRFAIKNLGRLSPQAFLVTAGTFIPLAVNICYTLGVPGFTIYSTPTAFSITITLYVFAMTLPSLLKVRPLRCRPL